MYTVELINMLPKFRSIRDEYQLAKRKMLIKGSILTAKANSFNIILSWSGSLQVRKMRESDKKIKVKVLQLFQTWGATEITVAPGRGDIYGSVSNLTN